MDNVEAKVAAFKQLLGLHTLPSNGAEALEASRQFSHVVLTTIRPEPPPPRPPPPRPAAAVPRFVDVSTGMRLRYLEWDGGDGDVVLLLHAVAECAEAWGAVAAGLRDRGYRAIALDLRGHGGSSRSLGGRYTAAAMAEDVREFIVAKDLYVRPVAAVGCGIGAAVALALAQAAPGLVGAVAAIEFGVSPELVARAAQLEPPEAPRPLRQRQDAVRPAPHQAPRPESMSSAHFLPWWSFWLGQGARFGSAADCAAFLCSPLANIGPETLLPLAAAAARGGAADARQVGEAAAGVREALSGLARPPGAAACAAAAMLQPPGSGGWAAADGFADDGVELAMDPAFFFTFDLVHLVHGVASLPCHLLVVRSTRSAWVPPADADALAAAADAAASRAVVALPSGSHHPATDCPQELLQCLVAFLEGPAVRCFDATGEEGARRPEALDLRPLPQYGSLEAAQRALGPRRVPTAAVVEEELRQLRLEAGQAAGCGLVGDDEEGEPAAEYFGFVG